MTGSSETWLGRIFRLKREELRSLSISGFTALFGDPLEGSLFSLEMLHHKHAVEYYKAIIPASVASCFSYLMFALIIYWGIGAIRDLKAYYLPGYMILPMLMLLELYS